MWSPKGAPCTAWRPHHLGTLRRYRSSLYCAGGRPIGRCGMWMMLHGRVGRSLLRYVRSRPLQLASFFSLARSRNMAISREEAACRQVPANVGMKKSLILSLLSIGSYLNGSHGAFSAPSPSMRGIESSRAKENDLMRRRNTSGPGRPLRQADVTVLGGGAWPI